MHEPITILRRQPTERSAPQASSRLSLPADLLEKARNRVKLVALLCLAAASIDVVVGLARWIFTSLTTSDVLATFPAAIPNLVSITLGLGLYGLARSHRVGHWTVLNAGLLFEVATCLIISIANPLLIYRAKGVLPELTWVTPLIIVFPLIIPSPPVRMLATAMAAAATAPLGLLAISTWGDVPVSAEQLVEALINPTIAALFAFFGTRVLYGLGIQISLERKALARERELGSYRLDELLGRGGMGEVWRARHRLLARPAAVKLIRPEALGNDEDNRQAALRRFEREAQATASLQSPHTIQLFDFGHTEDQTFYYVMELLDGLDLHSFVQRFGPLPSERVVHCLVQACHSLGEAHAKGLIHRDVKPANIYLCRLGREVDFVKLLDFGLVKESQRSDSETWATAEHIAVGTPAYIAPEQVLGDGAVDARSDLYALGCVAYWLLTGEPVFQAETAMKTMMHHASTPPVPPSQRTELSILPRLEEIILSCLEKDPKRRPQDADALIEALRTCSLPRTWTAERARSWWAAHLPVMEP